MKINLFFSMVYSKENNYNYLERNLDVQKCSFWIANSLFLRINKGSELMKNVNFIFVYSFFLLYK